VGALGVSFREATPQNPQADEGQRDGAQPQQRLWPRRLVLPVGKKVQQGRGEERDPKQVAQGPFVRFAEVPVGIRRTLTKRGQTPEGIVNVGILLSEPVGEVPVVLFLGA
jgi:hypothetical protein